MIFSCTYVLICPITGEVRYVGKSDRHLDLRQREHVYDVRSKAGRKVDWIRWLLVQGLEPIIEHDEDIPDGVDWEVREQERIDYYISIGCDLLNETLGGKGVRNPSAHVRAKMAKKAKGRKQSPETVAKRVARLRKPHSREWNAKIAAGHLGKVMGPQTPEQVEKRIAPLRGRSRGPMSEEQKAKVSDGLKRYFAANPKPSPASEPPKPDMRGKWVRTPESRAKTAATLKGRMHSPERCANISAGKLGKSAGPRSAEVRAKISAGHRRRLAAQGDLL